MPKNKIEKDAEKFRNAPRDSDNPIIEEYKEELLRKPTYSPRSVSQILSDEERMSHLEKLLTEINWRIDNLEKRIENLEKK